MPGSYKQLVKEDRRLSILIILSNADGYAANEHLLQSMLAAFGHEVGADRLRTDLHWLAEQDLVAVETIADIEVATITRRGTDVAAGRTTVPGVKRPLPGA